MSQNVHHTWKSVTRPGPHFGFPHAAAMERPPAVPEKPGGKMIVYVYEAPDELKRSGLKLNYPRSDECVRYDNARWKQRGKKVSPNTKTRASSVGGKMFQKQRERMKDFVVKSPAINEYQFYEYRQDPVNVWTGRERSKSLERGTNWSFHLGTKNMPAFINNTLQVKQNKGFSAPILRPLRSPPPEWRAKVESNYRLTDGYLHAQPRRRSKFIHEEGYESAPAGEEFDMDDPKFYASFNQDERKNSGVNVQTSQLYSRSHSRTPNLPADSIWNKSSSLVFVPYENDFNTRAVGWTQTYVDNY